MKQKQKLEKKSLQRTVWQISYQCVLLGLLALLRLLGGSGAEVVLAEAETTTAAADSRLVVVLLGGGTSPVLLEDIVHLLQNTDTVC